MLNRIGPSEVWETHFPSSSMRFFQNSESVGTPLVKYISLLGGTLSRRKFVTFQMLYSNGFGFNFFHEFCVGSLLWLFILVV